jgi:hypothetical protein
VKINNFWIIKCLIIYLTISFHFCLSRYLFSSVFIITYLSINAMSQKLFIFAGHGNVCAYNPICIHYMMDFRALIISTLCSSVCSGGPWASDVSALTNILICHEVRFFGRSATCFNYI